MTFRDLVWAVVGWQTAVVVRLTIDTILNTRDRRRIRRTKDTNR